MYIKIKPYTRTFSDDLSDEDALAYIREHEQATKWFFDQWKSRVGFIGPLFFGITILFLTIPRTREFAIMFLLTGGAVFLLELASVQEHMNHC